MKLLVIAMLAVAVAADHPLPATTYGPPADHIAILQQKITNNDGGSYEQHFETENGISVHEHGMPMIGEHGNYKGHAVVGHFSYYDENGNLVKVGYVADDKGFRPVGNHLPTPVPTEYPLPKVPDSPGDDGSYKPQTSYKAPADVYSPPAVRYSAP